jgi:hypothetical protein
MTAERKVVAIPATTYESVRLGQLFRVEGFVYVLVAVAPWKPELRLELDHLVAHGRRHGQQQTSH